MGWRCLVRKNVGTARPSAYSGRSRHPIRECEIFSLMWHAPGRDSHSKWRNGGRRTDPRRGLEVLLRKMHQGSRRRRPLFCLAVRGESHISGADPALSGKPIPPLALSTRRNSAFAGTQLQPPRGHFCFPGPNACVSVTVSWNQAALAPGKNPSWVSICSSFVVSGAGSSSRACPELLERPSQQADFVHETVPTASS